MAVQLTIEDAGPTYRVTVENLTPDVVTLGIEPIQAQQDVVLDIQPFGIAITDPALVSRVAALEEQTDGLVSGADPLAYYILARDN